VNRYLLHDKLEHDSSVQRKNLEVVQRILTQQNATKSDIDKLKEQAIKNAKIYVEGQKGIIFSPLVRLNN
jgi:tRNA(Ser,Leu) C12 N-acetylase TAN1